MLIRQEPAGLESQQVQRHRPETVLENKGGTLLCKEVQKLVSAIFTQHSINLPAPTHTKATRQIQLVGSTTNRVLE